MRTALIALTLAVACTLPALAQTPDSPDRGGVLVLYALDHPAPDTGRLAIEADFRFGGTPLLIVGHVTDGSAGIGPKVTHDWGPVMLFGHTLFGQFDYGAMAESKSQLKHGAGVDIPIGAHAVVRIGAEHTPGPMGQGVTASTVGVGYRF